MEKYMLTTQHHSGGQEWNVPSATLMPKQENVSTEYFTNKKFQNE